MTRLLTILFLWALAARGATWYVDYKATGSNNGTSMADAWTTLAPASDTNVLIGADDTVIISEGTYWAPYHHWGGYSPDPEAWGPPFGTEGRPVTIKCTNGLVRIKATVFLHPYTVIDGGLTPNYETNLVTAFDTDKITNNIGIWFDGSSFSNALNNVNAIGAPFTNKWCLFSARPGYAYTLQRDGIVGTFGTPLNGIDIGYCWFTNYAGAAPGCIVFNQNSATPAFGQWTVHHNVFDHWGTGVRDDTAPDQYGGGEWISAGSGLDFHHNICGRYPVLPFEDDGFQIGSWWRMWDNVFYPRGNSLMQSELGGTNYGHMYFYRNIVTFHQPSPGVSTPGNLQQINSWEGSYAAYGPTVTMTNVRIFNNTVICLTTNGPTGLFSFLNREYAVGQTIYPQTAGVLVYNNLLYATNSAQGNLGLSPGQGGVSNGWYYTPTHVLVDYNVMNGLAYNTNSSTYHSFNTEDFNAYSGFSHNTATQPTLRSVYAMGYEPLTVANGAGTNLSLYATDMPGLTADANGAAVGSSWSIGAYEPYSAPMPQIANTITNGLVLWLNFSPTSWTNTGVVLDGSSNSNNGVRYDANYFPNVTNGPLAGMWAAQYRTPTNVDQGGETHMYGEYIAVTNWSNLSYLTNGTITVWAYANRGSYGNSTMLDASYVGGVGAAGCMTNCFTLNRGGNENFRFKVMDVDGNLQNVVYFPDDTIGHGSGVDAFTMTNWAHYSVTWTGGGNAVGYYNGTSFVTNALGSPWLRPADNTCENPGNTKWIAVGVLTHAPSTPAMDYPAGDMYPNNGWFSGAMADVRIYNRALTATEIGQIYSGTESGGASPSAPTSLRLGTFRIGSAAIGHIITTP